MTYYKTAEGYKEDALIGNEGVVFVDNVKTAADADFKRGTLLAVASDGVCATVASAADASKPLFIAAQDFTADATHTVTSAFSSGVFNKEKIILPEGVDVEAFRQELRKQNIILTSIKEA